MTDSIKGKKLNKGEWAEFYVMLRLLGEGRLYAADNLLRKKYNSYLDLIKVIRQETESQVLEYIVTDDKIIIRENDSSIELATIPMSDFLDNAIKLYSGIKDLKGRSVLAPDSVCDFAKVIYVSKPKAPAVRALKKQFGGKNDIFVEVRDSQTSIISVMGFSIKSKFGSEPTLFNAGSSSQFLYKLLNCDDEKMNEFNNIFDTDSTGKTTRGWSKCVKYLSMHSMMLEYAGTRNPIYSNNLTLVRESMEKLLSIYVSARLVDDYSGNHNLKEMTERISRINPLNASKPDIYYEKAVKDFLMAGFTGMTAGKEWDGREQVTGGYIVVMDDGDVLCYHSNDREAFRDYLYRNTKFEYVSSDKYDWSRIFKVNNEYYLPLNISVRFTKQTR